MGVPALRIPTAAVKWAPVFALVVTVLSLLFGISIERSPSFETLKGYERRGYAITRGGLIDSVASLYLRFVPSEGRHGRDASEIVGKVPRFAILSQDPDERFGCGVPNATYFPDLDLIAINRHLVNKAFGAAANDGARTLLTFILLHEGGHRRLHHLAAAGFDRDVLRPGLRWADAQREEFEADSFAVMAYARGSNRSDKQLMEDLWNLADGGLLGLTQDSDLSPTHEFSGHPSMLRRVVALYRTTAKMEHPGSELRGFVRMLLNDAERLVWAIAKNVGPVVLLPPGAIPQAGVWGKQEIVMQSYEGGLYFIAAGVIQRSRRSAELRPQTLSPKMPLEYPSTLGMFEVPTDILLIRSENDRVIRVGLRTGTSTILDSLWGTVVHVQTDTDGRLQLIRWLDQTRSIEWTERDVRSEQLLSRTVLPGNRVDLDAAVDQDGELIAYRDSGPYLGALQIVHDRMAVSICRGESCCVHVFDGAGRRLSAKSIPARRNSDVRFLEGKGIVFVGGLDSARCVYGLRAYAEDGTHLWDHEVRAVARDVPGDTLMLQCSCGPLRLSRFGEQNALVVVPGMGFHVVDLSSGALITDVGPFASTDQLLMLSPDRTTALFNVPNSRVVVALRAKNQGGPCGGVTR